MRRLILTTIIDSPINLDDEVWDRLIRKIEFSLKNEVSPSLSVRISELGNRKNRPISISL